MKECCFMFAWLWSQLFTLFLVFSHMHKAASESKDCPIRLAEQLHKAQKHKPALPPQFPKRNTIVTARAGRVGHRRKRTKGRGSKVAAKMGGGKRGRGQERNATQKPNKSKNKETKGEQNLLACHDEEDAVLHTHACFTRCSRKGKILK